LLLRHPLPSTLFPYTTLFRSIVVHDSAGLYPPDSTAVIHVSYPPIYFTDGDTLRVGMRQRAYPPNQHPQVGLDRLVGGAPITIQDRKSTRLNSSHDQISYAVF